MTIEDITARIKELDIEMERLRRNKATITRELEQREGEHFRLRGQLSLARDAEAWAAAEASGRAETGETT